MINLDNQMMDLVCMYVTKRETITKRINLVVWYKFVMYARKPNNDYEYTSIIKSCVSTLESC